MHFKKRCSRVFSTISLQTRALVEATVWRQIRMREFFFPFSSLLLFILLYSLFLCLPFLSFEMASLYFVLFAFYQYYVVWVVHLFLGLLPIFPIHFHFGIASCVCLHAYLQGWLSILAYHHFSFFLSFFLFGDILFVSFLFLSGLGPHIGDNIVLSMGHICLLVVFSFSQ